MQYPAKDLMSTLVLLSLVFRACFSLDTMATNEPIKDGDILVSTQEIFALGFFSLGNSRRRYVGIWYYQVPEQTVVWVANRDDPLNDTSGVLSINGQGNLVLKSQNRSISVWSTNASVSPANNSMARLLDSGNLVLVRRDSQSVIWQSFDYPSNTMLPLMKLGLDRRTGLNRYLTAWKSADDPGTGIYSYEIDPSGYPQLFLYKNGVPVWRIGSWTGERWSGVPEMGRNFILNGDASFVNNQEEITIVFGVSDPKAFSRLWVDEAGDIRRSTWQGRKWVEFLFGPKELCDRYLVCGSNRYCDPYRGDEFDCTCFLGFEPKSTRGLDFRDGSVGCVSRQGVSKCRAGEGFVKLPFVKVPDTSTARANMSLSLKECKQECLRDCSCTAYTSAGESKGGIGCLTWHGDLVDGRKYNNVGQDLYVRVDAVVLGQSGKKSGLIRNKRLLAILVVSAAVVLLFGATIVHWVVAKKRKGRKRQGKYSFAVNSSTSRYFEESPSGRQPDGTRRNPDLPSFDLITIVTATDHFAAANKLGQGGFGSVYKGLLSNGKEIAIKRLSKHSGQGIEEFKNEVAIIARLQHKNLVRILGYCVGGAEKMIIYEYLPNKSLDSFIFDERKISLLDWGKRFDIICGVARGVLYLHQDSRLRIIHRDLKASNVLLDDAMNPKISDFGMARIFRSDQSQAKTKRVVGTYGYMSPEYALQGRFSVKSDIYSFGVLLLEIITGQRNRTYYRDGPSSNLIGHFWDLWREGKAIEMVDSLLGEKYPANEVSRCIQTGLLCVQENATDRPTMAEVIVFMLGNEATLPLPKKPAFILEDDQNDNITSNTAISATEITNSMIGGR